MAIVGFSLSVLSIVIPLLALAGGIVSNIAFFRLRRLGQRGRGLALAGAIIGYLACVIGFVMTLYSVAAALGGLFS